MLADALNKIGMNAYMVCPFYRPDIQDFDGLNAPLLTREIAEAHRAAKLRPIVVYSETVEGNPLKAKAIVRYVMNVPGLLGGPKTYDPSEFVYGYGRALANLVGQPERALFIPTIDLDRFPPGKAARKKTLVYASKFRNVHGAEPYGMPADAVEITRDMAGSPNSKQLVKLLQTGKRLYVFENTALAIEATLCGCPVVMMPNPYLTVSIGEFDHGHFGIAWGDDPVEIERAESNVSQARQGYQGLIDRYPEDLRRFAEATQAYRKGVSGFGVSLTALHRKTYQDDAARVAASMVTRGNVLLLARKGIQVLRDRGFLMTAKISWAFARHAARGFGQSLLAAVKR